MKINKCLLIFSMLLVLLVSFSAVNAENVSDEVISSDIAADEIVSIDSELNDVLTNDSGITLSLNVTASSTPYNENATIDVNIYDTNTSKDYNGSTVYLYIDGNYITNLTLDSQAKASYVVPAETYEVGSYYAMAVYMGDSDVILFNGDLLTIEKVIPIVNVNNVTSKSGDIVTIPFNVTDNKGKGISGDVIVTIYWENDSLSKYMEITNGTANTGFNLSDLIGIFGGNGTFNISDLLGGNGTFDIGSLLNGTTNITIGNSTFDIGGLMNGTFSLGNSTFDIGSLLNGTTTFSIGNTTIDFGSLFNKNRDNNTDDKLSLPATFDDILAGNSTFNFGDLFGGNGTFNIGDLFGGNGTFSIGNGTFNIDDLMNGNFTVGNSTFDIGSLLNGTTNITIGNSTFNLGGLLNGTGNGTFDISSLLDMFLGKGDNTFAYLFAPGTYN